MAGELIIKNGLVVSGSTNISGSVTATSFTGSFSGSITSASYAATASIAVTASYATNGGVTQLLAGSNISLSPTNGLGQVTITSTGGSGGTGNTATGSYGSFYDTTTQTNPVSNVPRSMSLNTTAITNGVAISGSTNPFNTYIKTQNAGVYDIQFSAQLDKTDFGTDQIYIWLRKNGIDLIDTATVVTLVGNNGKQVAAWNWFVNAATNDYFQIIWGASDTNVRLLAEPISSTHPGIPSVIVTANRVDQFLSNTGSFSGSFTGSLQGTSSWSVSASNALTASLAPLYVLTSTTSSMLAPYLLIANTSSMLSPYLLTSRTGSFATTGSGTFSGSIVISGSMAIGTSSLGPNENSLTLGARDTVNEGGQIGFNAPGGTYASASFIDLYQNRTRILKGTNAGSTGEVASWNMHTLQMSLPAYTNASSFSGTATANLAVDSSGNVITVSTAGGSVFPYTGSAIITGSLEVIGNLTVNTPSGDIDLTSTNIILNAGTLRAPLLNLSIPLPGTPLNTVLIDTLNGTLYVTSSLPGGGGGGGGTPGGGINTIQFNNAGTFSGSGNFTLVGGNIVLLTGSLNTLGSINVRGQVSASSYNGDGSNLTNLYTTPVLFNAQTSNYSASLSDLGKMVELTGSSPISIYIPPNSVTAIPTGSQITFIQTGTQVTTFVTGSGVTLNSYNNLRVLTGRYSVATCVKKSTDTWYLFGDLS